jgi:hypothetical protein
LITNRLAGFESLYPPALFKTIKHLFMKLTRFALSLSCALYLLSFMIAGCGRIVVTTKTVGIQGSSNLERGNLTVTRGDGNAVNTKRLYQYNGSAAGESLRLPAAQLKVEISGNPNNLGEGYNYIQLFSAGRLFDGGTSHAKSFTENNTGSIFYLTQPQQNGTQESSSNITSHIGAGQLFIIQNNDRSVPWQVNSGDSRCLTTGGTDCFDMRTFTRQLFSRLVNNVEPTVEALFSNPTVTRQELRYIPHVVHEGFEGEGRRARGFGLIYFAEISILTGRAFIYVPMKFLFLDDVNGYTFFIDPLDKSNLTPSPSVSRSIYVKGEFITGAMEGIIRDNIDTAISKLPSTSIIPGVANGELLMLGFNTASGQSTADAVSFRTTPIYDFILVPENRENGVHSTVLWRKDGDGDIENIERVTLFFLE